MATNRKKTITKKQLLDDLKKKGLKLPHGYEIRKRKRLVYKKKK